ncbi:MAG: hypothetical protein WD042_05190 [Phycisphaeraceae bacterium]
MTTSATQGIDPAKVQDLHVPMRRVTPTDAHYFFGYYDKTPWDASGRYVLACRIGFADRQPLAGEELTLGMIDLATTQNATDGGRFIELDRTSAWSWQQGTMFQWLGPAGDRQVIYNRIVAGRPVGIIRDVFTGQTQTLPMPIYTLTRDGRRAVSLDFGRLHRLRPGYGYASVAERNPDELAPADNGVFVFDLPTQPRIGVTGLHQADQPRLIASLAQLAQIQPREEMRNVPHWVNHLQIDPTGTWAAFLHRWPCQGNPNFRTRLMCIRLDGSSSGGDLRLVCDTPMFSHYDWRDDHTILAYAADPDGKRAFHLIDIHSGAMQSIGDDVLPQTDGHCSYSPDRNWILNDTYPDRERLITLMLYRPADQRRVDLARIYSSAVSNWAYRCDLHPRWNRDGTQICIDANFENTRGVYILDVTSITR